MNSIYIAAILTPPLSALVSLGISSWFKDPIYAPPGLYKMGIFGGIYTLTIVFVGIASQVSVLAIAVFGDVSFLSVVGVYIAGIIGGGVIISLCQNIIALNLLFVNLIAPGLLTVNLFMAHWLAWNNI